MSDYRHYNDTIHWHMAELTSRLVSESGIPSDRFHLGKIILQSFKDNPNRVLQIDGGTGQSETNAEALRRTIKCAISINKFGLKTGDSIVLMAPNPYSHIDLAIPFYAALCLGVMITAIDMTLKIAELQVFFILSKPKIIFCQSNKAQDVQAALRRSFLDAKIVTFNKDNHEMSFAEFLNSGDDDEIENFRPADFDPSETISHLIPTSGTTGPVKLAAATHKNFAISAPYFWSRYTEFPPFQRSLVLAPAGWASAIRIFIWSPIIGFTRVQSSLPITRNHAYYLINTYKPQFMQASSTLMTTLMQPEYRDKCDFTTFQTLMIGGSAVHQDLILNVKKSTPETEVINIYGISEITSIGFTHGFSSPPISCGKQLGCLQYKLVDIESGREINKPNEKGELWVKGPGVIKQYYGNPAATKKAFEGDWFKTGDIFYRDESWSYYFVERIKFLLKYNSYQISPVEVESVILQHPKVMDVVVTGISDVECGDLPVACVVPRPGLKPTAQEIKDWVKVNLAEFKQLRGGVVFMSRLPTLPSTKVNKQKIKHMVLTMKRE